MYKRQLLLRPWPLTVPRPQAHPSPSLPQLPLRPSPRSRLSATRTRVRPRSSRRLSPSSPAAACAWVRSSIMGTTALISTCPLRTLAVSYTHLSNHVCANCNRLRLTADGNVRPCLFSDAEYSVRDALRRGDDMQVLSIWRDAVAHKPQEHAIIEGTQRFMSQIGG